MVVEILLEPRLDEPKLGLPDDDPAPFLVDFPLDKSLCHGLQDYIQIMHYILGEEINGTEEQDQGNQTRIRHVTIMLTW